MKKSSIPDDRSTSELMTIDDGNQTSYSLESTATTSGECHESSDDYRLTFDPQTRSVTDAVVTAVAAADGTDSLELPPLWSVVDPDAIERFFSSVSENRVRGERSLSFEYAGHVVTVDDPGIVVVKPVESDSV